MSQTSIALEAPKTILEDTYIHKNDAAPKDGFLVMRENYQFYQERINLSYSLEAKLDLAVAEPVPTVKIETSIIEIGIGFIVGLSLGLVLNH